LNPAYIPSIEAHLLPERLFEDGVVDVKGRIIAIFLTQTRENKRLLLDAYNRYVNQRLMRKICNSDL
jgi:hypothetical protein